MPIGTTGPISFSALYAEIFGGTATPGSNLRFSGGNPASSPSIIANATGLSSDSAPFHFSAFRGFSGGGATMTNVSIQNNSLDIVISDVSVNGQAIQGVSFPVNAGNNATGYTTQLGTYTVTVDYTASIAGQHISFVDSELTGQCNNTSTGSQFSSFFDCVVNGNAEISINAADGLCV